MRSHNGPGASIYRVKLAVDIHPELLKALKIRAIEDGETLREHVHGILCREFQRPDLVDQASSPVEAG